MKLIELPIKEYINNIMEGHPIKRLRNLDDYEKEFAQLDKPCVTLVNKRV